MSLFERQIQRLSHLAHPQGLDPHKQLEALNSWALIPVYSVYNPRGCNVIQNVFAGLFYYRFQKQPQHCSKSSSSRVCRESCDRIVACASTDDTTAWPVGARRIVAARCRC